MSDDIDSQGIKKITRLVETRGMTRTYELSDGSFEERVGGTASWRHNNPGNLKYEYAQSADKTVHNHRSRESVLAQAKIDYAGVVDLDQRGNVIFETYDDGRKAQRQLVTSKRNRNKTVAGMLGNYSKPDYSGPTHYDAQEAMIYAIGDKDGFDLRTKIIIDMSPEEVDAVVDGISKFEGWTEGRTTMLSAEQVAERQARAQQAIHEAPKHSVNHLQTSLDHRHVASMQPHVAPNHSHILKRGDKGIDVGVVQQQLRDLGYTDSRGNRIAVDKDFGPATEAAVKAFQTDRNLIQDGSVGPHTMRALHERTQRQTQAQNADQSRVKTGNSYMDNLLASINDPEAFKGAMTDLSRSPMGQAFRAQGRAQFAEMQNQQLQAQFAQLHVQQQAQQQAQSRSGPVMSR